MRNVAKNMDGHRIEDTTNVILRVAQKITDLMERWKERDKCKVSCKSAKAGSALSFTTVET